MKALILIIGLMGFSQAYANHGESHCAPEIVDMGGETAQPYSVYPCGMNYTVDHQGCMEGEVSYFPVPNGSQFGGETTPEMPMTCHNGTFYPQPMTIAHHSCIEGEVTYMPIDNASQFGGETTPEVAVVCHNGKFEKMH